LKWSRAQQDISLALETHKPVLALLFDKTSWPVDNELENKLKSHAICLDFDAGFGEALSHQYDQAQLNKLVTQCNGILYGTGDIHPPEPPVSPDTTFHIHNEGNLGIVRQQSSPVNQKAGTRKTSVNNHERSKGPEKQVEILELSKPRTADIVEPEESEETQVQRMAASAVAAAVAGATAQHISKADNSPEAVKAAAAAAEVAQAVLDGNSDAAAKAVVKVAKIVEESSKNHSNSKHMSNGSVSAPPKSTTCIIL
jgi:hypothetical protein